MSEILRVSNVSKSFTYQKNMLRKITIKAVDQVSFVLHKGETIAIIGESGSGKSTLAKLLVGLLEPDEGEISIDGVVINQQNNKVHFQKWHQSIRLVFQLSDTQFNPRLTIGQLLEIPLKMYPDLSESKRKELVLKTLKQVGLSQSHLEYYPMTMAPGQRQRIALARALIVKPQVIIFDESFSSLDISSYSQIMNLMLDLQKKQGIAYIYISHNLGVIQHISDQLIVMLDGKVIEQGNAMEMISDPKQEVTKRLVQNFLELTT